MLRAFTGSMIAAIYVKYLLLNGLDLFQINLINCAFYGALILLDVPTGAFADVFGRKKSVVLSFFVFSLAWMIYGYSKTFVGFISAELIGALASTFLNGALRAWAVDQLQHESYAGEHVSLFGKVNVAAWCACIPGGIIGGKLLTIHSSLPWFVCSSILFLIAVFCMVFMKEDYFKQKKVTLLRSYKLMCITVRVSLRYVRENRVVRFVILSSIVQIFAVQAPNMQWVPRFESTFGGASMLGVAMASFAILNALGSYLAKRVRKATRDEEHMIMWCQVCIGVFIIGSALLPGMLGYIMFLLHQIPRGMYQPVKDAYFQAHITNRQRATMSSFESIVPNTGAVIALLGSGLIAKNYGIPMTWTISGSVLVVVAIMIAFNSSRHFSKKT